jgi:hypothetical protein
VTALYCWRHLDRPGHTCATPAPAAPAPDVSDGPYRGKVVDLVNPYVTIDTTQKGANKAPGAEYALWWLQRHPGRWALISERGMGVSGDIARGLGLTVRRQGGVGGNVYAQVPHPEAEELKEAQHRSATLLEALPPLERDPFGWTPAELADAAQIARDNLFPVADRKVA